MIVCVLLCYPVSIRIYYQQGVLFLVLIVLLLALALPLQVDYNVQHKMVNQYQLLYILLKHKNK